MIIDLSSDRLLYITHYWISDKRVIEVVFEDSILILNEEQYERLSS